MKTKKTNTDELTPKELGFCQFYTCIGESCCGNATRSAELAGYSADSAANIGWELLQRPVIRQRIAEICKERFDKLNYGPEKILSDLEDCRVRALADKQYSVAKECSVAQGRHLQMFADFIIAETPGRDLDEAEQAEASELARIRLGEKYGLRLCPQPPIPAVVEKKVVG